MSASAVGSTSNSVSQSLYQYYQATTQAGQQTSQTDASSTQAPKGGHHHHHGGGGGGLLSQIEQAVSSSLGASQSSGSTADPNQVIQDAIQSVLQGSSTAAPSSPSTTAVGGSQTATEGDADGSTSGSAGSSQSNPQQAFFQLLQQNGVNPQQFQRDLLSAIRSSSGGQFDSATAFQSFPPGSAINTLA